MAKNFVILYHAREGSTAIVDALSRHPDISIPISEELDLYWIKEFYNNIDFNLENTMDTVFAENQFYLGDDWGFKNFISDNKRGQNVASIGFKWRPHGKIKPIADVFLKHNVLVFLLSRRDILELTASLAISRYAKNDEPGSGHSQFKFAQFSDRERKEYREALEQRSFPVPRRTLYDIMARRCIHAARLKRIARRFAAHGVPVRSLFYEDFRDNPEQFFVSLFETIGVQKVRAESLMAGQIMKKVSWVPATKRIEAFEQKTDTPLCRLMTAVYSRALKGFP